jgi:hypothetical protein
MQNKTSDVVSSVNNQPNFHKIISFSQIIFFLFEFLITVLSVVNYNGAANKLKSSQCLNKHNAIKTFLTFTVDGVQLYPSGFCHFTLGETDPPPFGYPLRLSGPHFGLGGLGENHIRLLPEIGPQSTATPTVQCKTHATVYKMKVMQHLSG